ncbi:hypothetical protein KCV06_g303, partial [Aureobasidium melanogenum]
LLSSSRRARLLDILWTTHHVSPRRAPTRIISNGQSFSTPPSSNSARYTVSNPSLFDLCYVNSVNSSPSASSHGRAELQQYHRMPSAARALSKHYTFVNSNLIADLSDSEAVATCREKCKKMVPHGFEPRLLRHLHPRRRVLVCDAGGFNIVNIKRFESLVVRCDRTEVVVY